MKTKVCVMLAAVLLAGAAAQAVTVGEVETVTGGTFLNFSATADTKDGLTMTSVLGASVPDPRTTTTMVNWNLDDTSDATYLVNGKGVDDDGRSNSPWSGSNPHAPWAGPDYKPIEVKISGLTAGFYYELQMVALGRRYDPTTDPTKILENRDDNGLNNYDFSYGLSSTGLTLVGDVTVGDMIYELQRDGNGAFGGNIYKPAHPSYTAYKYFQGLYANSMGLWQANASGEINLYVGQGLIHDKNDKGARTQLDGISVVIPEPATLAILGLGGLGLLRRRK